ncbi:uncharacterized protein [Lepidochelys kempii]|uniref:uncharacterized protein isoform X3 n=1 Tax=Lepidochelys kempii TaxID=8472 RepID=UPI003C6F841E
MQEQMSHSQEGSGRFSAARRQSTEHTDEEQGQVDGAGRRELSVQFRDSGESDEDPDPPKDPLLNSLPELSVLERLGLHRVALTEQDVEAAFTHLALAFRCDMFTLRPRVQMEERARDVAEENIQQELEECRAALQEARMSRAAEVMVQHVENLKRHHLREHTELEEMKRLIQQNSRNRQLAENRDDGEQRLKLPLMRTFQQASARRRVSIAVIPKQLTPLPSPESGRAPEGEAAKAAWERSPSTERRTCCLQEDSPDGYFILRSDSSSSLHQSQPEADRLECEGNRGRYAEGSEPELRRRGSTSKPMKEEPDGASDSSGLTEELEQLSLTSTACGKETPWPWVFLPQHYWLFLGLLFLGLSCLVLMRILELQKQQPAPTPNS